MKGGGRVEFAVGVGLLLMVASGVVTTAFGANVTYDHRALVIDGKRRVLISGSIHYPRSTPEMWPDLIQKAKAGGLDVIDTYVFWNLHEPVREQWDFQGRKDLVRFLKLVAEAGLYAHLRIGPYIEGGWNFGGLPVWLRSVPGLNEMRVDNKPFKAEMKRFATKIVEMMKKHKLYAPQGGPIILSQIEHEYGEIQGDIDPPELAKKYINWAASMATSLNTEVPWVMCQQDDAPDPIINTCNGFYCEDFTPNSPKKPKMWTENWTGSYAGSATGFGDAIPHRPVEDIAFAVALFYQLGGTFQNYYMYHGGTNFGHSAGIFGTTSYDYDAPIDEFGMLNQPKWGHLRDLHKAIKLCEGPMVATDPKNITLAPDVEAAVYKTDKGLCAAFLANLNNQSAAAVNFNGKTYHLPAWSVSILPDCNNVVFNTAQINSVEALPEFIGEGDLNKPNQWSWVNEPVGISVKTAFNKNGIADQIDTTGDRSDYLWYSLSVDIKGDERFLQDYKTSLVVSSSGHVLYGFVNGKLVGNHDGLNQEHSLNALTLPITLNRGTNKIEFLSATVGLQNFGAGFGEEGAGLNSVRLITLNNSDELPPTLDFSNKQCTYQIGLKGEELGLQIGSSSLWLSKPHVPTNQTFTWYKTNFDAPVGAIGDHPIALNLESMGKGEAWINGQSIGRYWPNKTAPNTGCVDFCDYRGDYNETKCLKNCGKPSQMLYHVPRSWLKPKGNVLVLFEEKGGYPTRIRFVSRKVGYLCANVSQTQPAPIEKWIKDPKTAVATLSLECPYANQTISSIDFVSYGNPTGSCGLFTPGTCSSREAMSVVQKACSSKRSCSIEVSDKTFGDPCPGVAKRLAVQAICSKK